MNTFLMLLLGTTLTFAVPEIETDSAGETAASAADLNRMQGDWMVSSMKTNGLKQPEEEAQALFRTVKENTYIVSRYTREIVKGAFKLDASQSPKAIDSTPANHPEGPPLLGIYEFDGDKLRVCNAPPGKPRPKDFEARLGSLHTVVVWEREGK